PSPTSGRASFPRSASTPPTMPDPAELPAAPPADPAGVMNPPPVLLAATEIPLLLAATEPPAPDGEGPRARALNSMTFALQPMNVRATNEQFRARRTIAPCKCPIDNGPSTEFCQMMPATLTPQA